VTSPRTEALRDPVAVSVVIPTYNRRELLLRTLRSVLAQRGVHVSVIVVDEAGTDGSAEAVQRLADPRVRLVRHEVRRGVAQARNTGLEQVDADWVAFVDDDDLWAPEKLCSQIDALRQLPPAQWACTGAVNVDSRCNVLSVAFPPPRADIADLMMSSQVIPGGGSGVLVTTALAREVGGFDTALSNLADWDFYARLSLRSPVASAPALLVGYRIDASGMAHDIERSSLELGYLDAKFADERRARGVSVDLGPWLHYLGGLAYRRGQRWVGTRLQLQAARHGDLRSLRSLAGIFLPDRVHAVYRRRGVAQVPADEMQAARRWLAAYAEAG
jgi:Glycosyl transferase family 2